jgi:hypothetical protein
MPTPEEVSAWSFEEILAETQALLPKGSAADVNHHPDGYWVAFVERTTPEGKVVDQEETHPDRRMAVLNLFGRIWLNGLPKPSGSSPWVRRRELNREAVTRKALGIPDPEDLDPVEIDLVYQTYRK